LKVPILRIDNVIDPEDPKCIRYEDKAIVDLSFLNDISDPWCIDLPHAEVTNIPQDYSPKTLQYLGVLWNLQWSNILKNTGATYLSISNVDQKALDLIDRRICDHNGKGRVVLQNPKTQNISRWFSSNFDCPAVHITESESVDFRSAEDFQKIDVLSIEDVNQVKGLDLLARKGSVGTLILRNSKVVDAENFWNMGVRFVILDFDSTSDASWFLKVWNHRPVNWRDKVIFSGALADELHPEWSTVNSYESVSPKNSKIPVERSTLERDELWKIIDDSLTQSEGDVVSILEELEANLAERTAEFLAAFHFEMIKIILEGDRHAVGLHESVSPFLHRNSAVFAAILHGKETFEEFKKGVVDPIRLGISDPEDLQWSSNLVFLAGSLYESLTGLDIFEVFGTSAR